ncbi:DUF4276 family protein [Streptomyces sp. SPB074]|uniref:DUF4276 family protein n=1 Tax=Streptomyces sp. (strain SPB074) TaxID=465543 RepID=UPI00017F29A2|nr:DUF4276 family protein [Streptomyces sp. SPB074]EDY46045.1 conserved hypothetical protein [Streptomyces sp. SPB074]
MRQIHVLVEGATEERLVQRVFGPELTASDVWITPVMLKTRRAAGRPHDKGGVSKWPRIEHDIRGLLRNSALDAVTTMLDLYGLPSGTPGLSDAPAGDPYARVEHVEAAMAEAIGDPRFLPFLALHETEAWVLAAAEELGELIAAPRLGGTLRSQVVAAGGPELVNGGSGTAPSKRLLKAHPAYRKVVDGPDAVELLGPDALRAACPHLDGWLKRLEPGSGPQGRHG